MKVYYAKEKLAKAVYCLATGSEDIKKRLWYAYLSFHTLTEDHFPDDMKNRWKELSESLKSEEPTLNKEGEPIKGRVENTIDKLTIEKCCDIAKQIVDLNFEIRR